MSYGLTSAGFNRKPFSVILQEVKDTLRSTFGESINLVPPSVLGTTATIYAEREALIWELAEGIYNSQFPDTATGVSLDNVVAINGITRQPAVRSVGEVFLFGSVGTTVDSGTQLSVQGNPQAVFETLASATLVAGQNAIQEVSFAASPASGNFRLVFGQEQTALIAWDANAADIKAALEALNSIDEVDVTGNFSAGFTIEFVGDDGLQPKTLLFVIDNTLEDAMTDPVPATTIHIQLGQSQATVDVRAIEFGPIVAAAGLLNVIDTPVAGLDRVLNAQDIIVGRNRETDLELRQRRLESFQISGSATVDAIVSRVRNVDQVTDMEGRPPHSFETIVQGGADQVIADEIFRAKAAGIKAWGSQFETVIDTQGISHQVGFSRPVDVDIYMVVNLTHNNLYPSDGDQLVQEALVNRGRQEFNISDDVIVIPTLIAALAQIPGILTADLLVGTAPAPTLSNNIPIAQAEVAAFDTSRVTVNSTPV
jgi:uncharacterized phage protein gp47/JayE